MTLNNNAENKAEEVVSQGQGGRRECADSAWLSSRNAFLIAYLPRRVCTGADGVPACTN